MSNSLAPEPILRAALDVLYMGAYTTRNWTLGDEVSRKQINALWEALHNIPSLLKHWPNDDEGLALLRMYFREYDQCWSEPKLEARFDDVLSSVI